MPCTSAIFIAVFSFLAKYTSSSATASGRHSFKRSSTAEPRICSRLWNGSVVLVRIQSEYNNFSCPEFVEEFFSSTATPSRSKPGSHANTRLGRIGVYIVDFVVLFYRVAAF